MPSVGARRTTKSAAVTWDVETALTALKRRARKATRDGMARFGLPSDHALGVSMGDIQQVARQIGRDHGLAGELWKTGVYEARLLVAYVADPARTTVAQMNRWCRDFDNWGVCDTLCFVLFDKTPHAWGRVAAWAGRRTEFEKRAAFALLWGLTVHDKQAEDARFIAGLALIRAASGDERHFVKKAVNMALRAIGKRKPALHAAAVSLAEELAASDVASARWIGKDALRELKSPSVQRRLAVRGRRRA